MTKMQDTAKLIGNTASSYITIMSTIGVQTSPEQALNEVCRDLIDQYRAADKREGRYARTLTTEELEEIGFRASVANDILLGTVERPSLGNSRAYTLHIMAGE